MFYSLFEFIYLFYSSDEFILFIIIFLLFVG